jgi:hypothetical protein
LSIEGLSRENILNLALETQFMKRKPKKIDPYNFLNLVCTLSVLDTASFSAIATKYSIDYCKLASKQAISKKMKVECMEFFKSILAQTISSKLKISNTVKMLLNKDHKRVLVQDSTILRLPLRLLEVFSGMKNAAASVCVARIQGVYDIISGNFIDFSIDPYSKNDLLAAPQLSICKSDLILRDRGYFTVDEVQRHVDVEADCIFRFKVGTILRCPRTDIPIDLLKLLKKKKYVDMVVCMNNEQRTKIRLIASPVSDNIANKRRANAKHKTSRSKNPSQRVLQLMSWTIFITTISNDKATFKKIFVLYSLRWRIEIIFKAWKSHASFTKIHNVSEIHLKILLTARFIMIVIFVHFVYNPCLVVIRIKYKREISLLKLFSFLTKNIEQLGLMLKYGKKRNRCVAEKYLVKYCTYDLRKRLNFNQLLQTSFLS